MLISLITALAIFAQTPDAPDGFSQQVIQKAYAELVPATCLITYTSDVTNPNSGETSKREASALGIVVSPGGLVMAPGHMQLENSEPFNIRIATGHGDSEHKYEATLLKKPEDVNICFLQIQSTEPLNLPYAKFTRGVSMRIGEPLLLVGVLSETLDFARGIFTCRIGAVLDKPRTTYCLDSAIRFGFVSGPVINAKGHVVGVVGFDLAASEGGDLYVHSGHPLVYQADLFQKYIDKPQEASAGDTATGDEAWLGVFTQPLNDDYAEYWGLDKNGGLIVSGIVDGSPAATAGLQPGDIITQFNDIPIRAKLDREVIGFTKLVRDTGTGKEVAVTILRDGKPLELKTTLAARPKSARDAGEHLDEALGLTVREITTDLRILLNLAEDVKGVIVRRVRSGSVANLAGIRPGVIIMSLGDFPTGNIEEYKAAIEKLAANKPKEVTAFCRAGAATGFFRLEPRWDAVTTNSDTVQAK